MTGVDIVGGLLREYQPLLDMIASPRIKAGALPDGVELSALLIRSVSGVDRQTLKRGATVRTIERVSVAVRAENYAEQVAVMALVRRCCGGWVGNRGVAKAISILTAGQGPDVRGPGDSFEQTQDFRVSYDSPA